MEDAGYEAGREDDAKEDKVHTRTKVLPPITQKRPHFISVSAFTRLRGSSSSADRLARPKWPTRADLYVARTEPEIPRTLVGLGLGLPVTHPLHTPSGTITQGTSAYSAEVSAPSSPRRSDTPALQICSTAQPEFTPPSSTPPSPIISRQTSAPARTIRLPIPAPRMNRNARSVGALLMVVTKPAQSSFQRRGAYPANSVHVPKSSVGLAMGRMRPSHAFLVSSPPAPEPTRHVATPWASPVV